MNRFALFSVCLLTFVSGCQPQKPDFEPSVEPDVEPGIDEQPTDGNVPTEPPQRPASQTLFGENPFSADPGGVPGPPSPSLDGCENPDQYALLFYITGHLDRVGDHFELEDVFNQVPTPMALEDGVEACEVVYVGFAEAVSLGGSFQVEATMVRDAARSNCEDGWPSSYEAFYFLTPAPGGVISWTTIYGEDRGVGYYGGDEANYTSASDCIVMY